MNGIKMKDCRFYVDEDARTVVCVIPNTENMVRDFIDEHNNWPDVSIWYRSGSKLGKMLKMPYSFSGKAVCSPDDNWDVELGKKLAFSRAKDKCYKSFFKRANHYVQTVDRRLGDMITIFNDFGMKLEDKRDILQNEINDYMGVSTEEEE